MSLSRQFLKKGLMDIHLNRHVSLVSEKDLMQFTADENKLKIILFEISRKYKILPPPWPDLAVSLPLVS